MVSSAPSIANMAFGRILYQSALVLTLDTNKSIICCTSAPNEAQGLTTHRYETIVLSKGGVSGRKGPGTKVGVMLEK